MGKARSFSDSDLPGLPDIPADVLEDGRKLFAGPCDFMLGVAGLSQLPEEGVAEVAFAGRSNVGKSSLVNALTGRKTLARVSNTPGRTQQLNFFDLGEGRLRLVDLPGYGFAKVPVDQVEAWTRLLKSYLRGRVMLRRTIVLVDARHGIKPVDLDIMKMLDETAVVYQLVLTKCDKISGAALEKLMGDTAATLKKHPAAMTEILPTSSEKGLGIASLRARLFELTLD